MRESNAKTAITLAQRECSALGYTWIEYLVITRGNMARFLLATADYLPLADAIDYYDPETETYELPNQINGQKVIGLQNDYIVGGDLWFNSDKSGYEFDDLADTNLAEWLKESGWDSQFRVTDMKIAILWKELAQQ